MISLSVMYEITPVLPLIIARTEESVGSMLISHSRQLGTRQVKGLPVQDVTAGFPLGIREVENSISTVFITARRGNANAGTISPPLSTMTVSPPVKRFCCVKNAFHNR
jgi:hypothetical protein